MFYNATKENAKVLGQQELSRCFSLFSHFTRLKTLEEVALAGETGLNTIVEVNGLHDITVRNNLSLLKKYGFITGQLRSNQNLHYKINYDQIDKFKKVVDEYFELLNQNRFPEQEKPIFPMNAKIKDYLNELTQHFDTISQERKTILEQISSYIRSKVEQDKPVNLVYICTHNSRRSHLGQIWAKVSSDYFNISNVNTFSGGTEATAFNINAISALQRVGFNIQKTTNSENPIYHVYHNEGGEPSICFSKVYDNPQNPGSEFAAVMTCSDAEENCPFIPGVELRVGTTYDDPKAFDNTPLQDQKYDERCRQIALETLYAFSMV